MYVLVDDVWASPSNLHVRVTVLDDNHKWRQRFYEAIPLETIPEECLVDMLAYLMKHTETVNEPDTPLF